MPRLALVDGVDLARLLAFGQQSFQRGRGAEAAEPGHLDVHRVADAVRAGQGGGVPECAQPALLLDAPGQAGDPERGGCGRGGGEVGRQPVEQVDHLRPGQGEAQARGARDAVRPQPAVHRAHRPQRQGPGLAPIAEMEFPAAAEWLEIDQVGSVGQVRIQHEGPGRAPPHDVDQGEKVNPDMGDQVGCAIAGAGLIMAHLAEQPVHGRGTALRAGRQDRRELRARQPFGQDSFRLGQIPRAGMAGDLEQQIGDGAAVPGEIRLSAGRHSVSVHSRRVTRQ